MSVLLYRLYAVQTFNKEKVAVYINEGNFPDGKILTDAMDIVNGLRLRKEVVKDSFYTSDAFNRLDTLTRYTRILRRSKKVMDENENVSKAIFVEDTDLKTWKGEHKLYENRIFDMIKADTPEFTGCTEKGTINI